MRLPFLGRIIKNGNQTTNQIMLFSFNEIAFLGRIIKNGNQTTNQIMLFSFNEIAFFGKNYKKWQPNHQPDYVVFFQWDCLFWEEL